MISFHIFIISWSGKHEKALNIAHELKAVSARVSIVYSDADPGLTLQTDTHSIRRPNHLFWSDKFKACLDACEADVMLVIHADCECENWVKLFEKCRSATGTYRNVGVWSPLVLGTYFESEKASIAHIPNSDLKIVVQTNGLVFALTKPVLYRMRQANYKENIYGWGIDWMFVAFSYFANLLVLVDTSILVRHASGSGYEHQDAMTQMHQFLTQLSGIETIQYKLLETFFHKSTIIQMKG